MSTTELLVSVFGLFIGYWIISAALGKAKPPSGGEARNTENAQGANDPPPGADNGWFRPEEARGSQRPVAPQAPQEWYAVLGVSPNATLEEAQVAFRALIRQYHPDKVDSLGPELRELAEEKTKAINRAYNQALAVIGARH